MSSYYNYGGGYIYGECDVLLPNNNTKKVKEIIKGDIVMGA